MSKIDFIALVILIFTIVGYWYYELILYFEALHAAL